MAEKPMQRVDDANGTECPCGSSVEVFHGVKAPRAPTWAELHQVFVSCAACGTRVAVTAPTETHTAPHAVAKAFAAWHIVTDS